MLSCPPAWLSGCLSSSWSVSTIKYTEKPRDIWRAWGPDSSACRPSVSPRPSPACAASAWWHPRPTRSSWPWPRTPRRLWTPAMTSMRRSREPRGAIGDYQTVCPTTLQPLQGSAPAREDCHSTIAAETSPKSRPQLSVNCFMTIAIIAGLPKIPC